MKDKEDELIRDVLKYFLIFMLILSAPIWGPIVFLGAFICFPVYLIYLLFDEFNEDNSKEQNNNSIK